MAKLLVANWKMNLTHEEIIHFFDELTKKYTHKRQAWIAPQAIHFSLSQSLARPLGVAVGIQNCSSFKNGAYTGEISPFSFKEMGGDFVILGHSERRQLFKESSSMINLKIKAALAAGLKVIYCIGETLGERESQQTFSIVSDQLNQGLSDLGPYINGKNLLLAYEPVWAIGTGKTATADEAQNVHSFIRGELALKFPLLGHGLPLLYGGSMKPENVEKLLAQKDIDGGLVGGAALKATDFLALCGDI